MADSGVAQGAVYRWNATSLGVRLSAAASRIDSLAPVPLNPADSATRELNTLSRIRKLLDL